MTPLAFKEYNLEQKLIQLQLSDKCRWGKDKVFWKHSYVQVRIICRREIDRDRERKYYRLRENMQNLKKQGATGLMKALLVETDYVTECK